MHVSHNRNYQLFTNQKSKYPDSYINIDFSEIIQISAAKHSVPSETFEMCGNWLICKKEYANVEKDTPKNPVNIKKQLLTNST